VLISVFAHGLTAKPLATRYGGSLTSHDHHRKGSVDL
jgi:hypothetical protein